MTIRTMNQTQGCAANALLPGTSFAFLPADMVSQILNFGVPAPTDLQVIGNDLQANRKYANDLLSRIKQIPRYLRCADPANLSAADLERQCRSVAGGAGRSE
jgi:hypothetical protein